LYGFLLKINKSWGRYCTGMILSDHGVAVALVFYTLGLAMWLVVNGVRVTMEDGFYYLKIAQNIAHGAGSTFDGFNLTNGYHPLWLLILVPLFWLTAAPHTGLALAIVIQAIFLATTATLLYYTARLSVGRFAASLAALFWVLLTYQTSLGGLEFSLHAVGLLATAYVYLRWFSEGRPQPPRGYLLLGLLLSLTFLARLDSLLLAGIIGLFLAWRELKGGLTPTGTRRLLALGIPVLLICLIYVSTNLVLFRYPLPVSGVIKQTWSAYLLTQDGLYLEQGWVVAKANQLLWPLRHLNRPVGVSLFVGTFGITGLWLVAAWGRSRVPQLYWLNQLMRPWQPFIQFSLLNFLSYALLYHQYLSFPAWYYVVQPWLTTLLLAVLIDKLAPRWTGGATQNLGKLTLTWRRLALIGLIAIWCSVPAYTVWNLEQWRRREQFGTIPQPLYDGAAWVEANLPTEAVVGAWNAGAIGYLSDRRVVNLDGLVNSWDYYQTDRYNLCRYWQEVGVTHVVDIFDYRSENLQAVAPEPTYSHFALCADQLELLWSDDRHARSWWRLEAYRVRPLDD
jgi:hypothetical protein